MRSFTELTRSDHCSDYDSVQQRCHSNVKKMRGDRQTAAYNSEASQILKMRRQQQQTHPCSHHSDSERHQGVWGSGEEGEGRGRAMDISWPRSDSSYRPSMLIPEARLLSRSRAAKAGILPTLPLPSQGMDGQGPAVINQLRAVDYCALRPTSHDAN